MTIAIGLRCGGGLILAADTRITLTDGSATIGTKLTAFAGQSGQTFAIANASEDANASNSLVRRLTTSLCNRLLAGWSDFEDTVCHEMTTWAQPFTQGHPSTQLLTASFLSGHGACLYFCEPPNTILPKPAYIAAGNGASVTDPLHAVLFQPMLSARHPQKVLRQLAYLMYRAKQHAALCGGRTEAVYVREDGLEPQWVWSTDLEDAERAAVQLDHLLLATMRVALFADDDRRAELMANFTQVISENVQLRHQTFRNAVDGLLIAPP